MQANKKAMSSPMLLTKLPPLPKQEKAPDLSLNVEEKENDNASSSMNVNDVQNMDEEITNQVLSPRKAEKRGPITPREKNGYPHTSQPQDSIRDYTTFVDHHVLNILQIVLEILSQHCSSR
jgi:hypothetical protein